MDQLIYIPPGAHFGKLTVIKFKGSIHNQGYYICKCDCGNETTVSSKDLRRGHTKSCGCIQNKNMDILSGTRFGKLTVIGYIDSTKHGKRRYLCKCDCGNETKVVVSNLLNGHTKSCGCYRHEVIPTGFKDMTGKRFGRLVIIERKEDSKKTVYWKCKCDCGNIVFVGGKELRNGHTKSCGCYNKVKRFKPEGVASFNRLFGAYKRSAKTKGRKFSLSAEEFEKLTSDNCFYCGAVPSSVMINKNGNGNLIYNGIDRVDNSKGYIPGNCVTCCTACNLAKREMSQEEFYAWVERVYAHSILKK